MFQAGTAELFSMPDFDLLANSVEAASAEIRNGIAQSGEGWDLLVMDLTNVNLIDVRGIQLIEEAYKTAKDKNKQFMLINVSETILRYLQLFRLHTKFPIGLNKTSAQLEAEKKSSGRR
jgi:anti-anti-sigma factor